MKYLVVHDDGYMEVISDIDDSTYESWDDGYLDVVKVEEDKFYFLSGRDEWTEVVRERYEN